MSYFLDFTAVSLDQTFHVDICNKGLFQSKSCLLLFKYKRILIQDFTNYSFLALPILGVLLLYIRILIWFGLYSSLNHWSTHLLIKMGSWAPSSPLMLGVWNQSTWITGTERREWSLSCWPQIEYRFTHLGILPCFSNNIPGPTYFFLL